MFNSEVSFLHIQNCTTSIEKCEHDLELKQLKEEVRSGKQIKESLEQEIKRGEEHLEERTEAGEEDFGRNLRDRHFETLPVM